MRRTDEKIDQELSYIKKIVASLKHRDLEDVEFKELYPECDLEDRSLGYFVPDIPVLSCFKLPHFFPFFDTTIVPILPNIFLGNPKGFEDLYGVSVDQMVELAKMGRVLPLLCDLPGIEGFLQPLENEGFPNALRGEIIRQILRYQIDLDGVVGPARLSMVEDIWKTWASVVLDQVGYSGNRKTNEKRLTESLQLLSEAYDMELPVAILLACTHTQEYARQGFILSIIEYLLRLSFGRGTVVTLPEHMAELIVMFRKYWGDIPKLSDFLEKDSSIKGTILYEAILRQAVTRPNKAIHLQDFTAQEILAQFREEYLYETFDRFDDPIKLASHLERSDNTKEWNRIITQIDREIKRGHFKNAVGFSRQDIIRAFREINKEIQSLEKKHDKVSIGFRLGFMLLGVFEGAAASWALSTNDLLSAFMFAGQAAGSMLLGTKSMSDELAENYVKKNSAYMIWKLKD